MRNVFISGLEMEKVESEIESQFDKNLPSTLLGILH